MHQHLRDHLPQHGDDNEAEDGEELEEEDEEEMEEEIRAVCEPGSHCTENLHPSRYTADAQMKELIAGILEEDEDSIEDSFIDLSGTLTAIKMEQGLVGGLGMGVCDCIDRKIMGNI